MTPFPREAYRPLVPYATDRRPVPIDLSDNTNRWGTHPAALQAVREADPEALIRYPSVYADDLRRTVAQHFEVPLESVATGCGSDDLLDSAFRALCDPGDSIGRTPPTFSMIEIFAQMNDLRVVPFDEGDLRYLCRPNNPTGTSIPRDEVVADGRPLLIDEAYADFADDDLVRFAAESKGVVVLRTLSKAYGLAGLRVGFAIGDPVIIAEMEKSRGPYKVNQLAERAAVAALPDAEGWVRGIIRQTREGRAYLMEALQALNPVPSQANFILLPVSDAAAATAALREAGIAVRPFPDLPEYGDCIRITIGPRPELDAFLDAFRRIQ